jgi:hypothetical protein
MNNKPMPTSDAMRLAAIDRITELLKLHQIDISAFLVGAWVLSDGPRQGYENIANMLHISKRTVATKVGLLCSKGILRKHKPPKESFQLLPVAKEDAKADAN